MAAPGGIELTVFAAIGLLGGAHCLGMCGPLLTAYTDRMDATGRAHLRQHGLFNLGRTAGYTVAGAVMGLLGATVYDVAAVTSTATAVRAVAGITVGCLVIATGVHYLKGSPRGMPIPAFGGAFGRVQGWLAPRLDRWVRGPKIAGLGTIHAVLPCPLLWPAYLYALALGDPIRGAIALGVLGLGTFPTMFAYGTAVGSMTASTRVRLHRALGVAFVVLGLLPLTGGLRLIGVPLPTPPIPFYQPL